MHDGLQQHSEYHGHAASGTDEWSDGSNWGTATGNARLTYRDRAVKTVSRLGLLLVSVLNNSGTGDRDKDMIQNNK